MAKDFFDSLGENISRTARELSEKAENFYEVQKLRNQISSEERIVSKTKENLGNLIYKRYAGGEVVDDEVASICGEISQHTNKINELKDFAARKAGQKICLSCQHVIDKKVFFCPFCGAPCAKEEKAEDKQEEIFEEEEFVQSKETSFKEAPQTDKENPEEC